MCACTSSFFTLRLLQTTTLLSWMWLVQLDAVMSQLNLIRANQCGHIYLAKGGSKVTVSVHLCLFKDLLFKSLKKILRNRRKSMIKTAHICEVEIRAKWKDSRLIIGEMGSGWLCPLISSLFLCFLSALLEARPQEEPTLQRHDPCSQPDSD